MIYKQKLILLIISLFICCLSKAQSADSTSYYRKIFKDEANVCNGLRQKAYDYLKSDLKTGMRYKKVLKRLPAEFHISKDRNEAKLVLITRCGGDEEVYFKMATYLVLDFEKGKLINIRLINHG